jgi:hypothetical protein
MTLNYTDAITIRNAMGGQENAQDTLLEKFAGIASRSVDHICAQTGDPGCIGYFALEPVTGESLTNAVIDQFGHLVCYPHKSSVRSVASLAYAAEPDLTPIPVPTDLVVVRGHAVEAWLDLSSLRGRPLLVTLSYTGGMASSLQGLDPILVDCATVLAIRKYKEERSGMSDVVGVVELGTITYTEGIPASVVRDLTPFRRVAPWT